MYYQNVRSFNNKLSYLRSSVNLLTYTPAVLMFTETWLKPTTNDAELGLKKFCIFRLDRHDSPSNCVRGGGVLLAVNRKFKSTLLENASLTESVFLKVESKTAKFIIAVVYLPPDSSTIEYRRFLAALEDFSSRHPQHKLCVTRSARLMHSSCFLYTQQKATLWTSCLPLLIVQST